ncbi:MAG: hypothetical protein H0U76_01770, partial [Ktedonobacteraceae bacterium]|nr:hypothetical protein [Ktedonobacteraceae bacterium]
MSTSPTQTFNLDNTSKSNTNHNLLSVLGSAIVLAILTAYVLVLTGCGASGYAGGGIVSLSASSVTIDAGQSFSVSSNLSGKPTVTWSLPGTSCSPNGCGTLSSTTGDSIVYTAP